MTARNCRVVPLRLFPELRDPCTAPEGLVLDHIRAILEVELGMNP